MKMFRKTKSITSKAGVLHFERWAIIETSLFALYLHRIHQPDKDHHHSHPYGFCSLILRGSYLEELCNAQGIISQRVKSPGVVGCTPKTVFHKIKDVLRGPVYTVVLVGGDFENQEWGYLVNGKYVDNRRYRDLKVEAKKSGARIESYV